MADVDVADGVPMLAVTAAVGAVMLLFVLVCSIGKREKKDKVAGELPLMATCADTGLDHVLTARHT